MAARPIESCGMGNLDDTTTPTDQDKDPNNTAPMPILLEACRFNPSAPKIATPARPTTSPRLFIQLIFSLPATDPSSRMNIGSVAISSAAKPDVTNCSAQCKLPCPIKKNKAPTIAPAAQLRTVGRNPRRQAHRNNTPPASEWRIATVTSGGMVSIA